MVVAADDAANMGQRLKHRKAGRPEVQPIHRGRSSAMRQSRSDRERPEQRALPRTAGAEDGVPVARVRCDEVRHILDHADDGHVHALEGHRVDQPEEIADICVFLCTDMASYFVGANIFIDGGMTSSLVGDDPSVRAAVSER